MILSDKWIREQAKNGMIEPFMEKFESVCCAPGKPVGQPLVIWQFVETWRGEGSGAKAIGPDIVIHAS